ncbi:hypothetical protein ACVW0J_007026 [Bradyrhizobium sp. i1.7.7]
MGPGSATEARETIAGESTLTLVPTFVVVAVDATGMGIILPLLPFYSQRLGATPFLLGALISAYAVCQLVAGPVVGMLSDRYGRRKVLVVSQIGTFIGFILLALAGNLTLVFLARIIDGLTSGNISVAHAYAAEHSAPATRKQALGMTSGAIGTGLLLGPALSSFLVHYGQTAPVWAAAALSLISIVATIALLPPDHPASEPLYQHRVPEPTLARSLLGMRYAWRLLGLLIVFFFVNSMFLSQIGLFLSARFSWDGHPFGARELGWIVRLCRLHQHGGSGTAHHACEHHRVRPQHRDGRVRLHGSRICRTCGPRQCRPARDQPDTDHRRHHVRAQHADGRAVALDRDQSSGHDHGPQPVADVGREYQRAAPERRADRSSAVRSVGACYGRHRGDRRGVGGPVTGHAAGALAPSPQFTT